ncbi:MAG: hypothetical protein AAB267_00765, partial [Candidatus Desantisbacteria bacterium]
MMEGIGFRQKLVWLLSASALTLGIGLFVPNKAEALTITTMTIGSGTVGTVVTIEGTHTGPAYHSNVVCGTFGTSHVDDGGAGNESTFTFTFTVNTQSYGTKVITISENDGTNIDTTTFFILPNLYSCNPLSGPVGTFVTIEGCGFGTENVSIDFGTHQTITTRQCSNYEIFSGTFSATFLVSTQVFGTKVITARDSTNSEIKDTTTFFITSRIYSLFPTSGTFSQTVTIEGSGYRGNNSTVTIHFGLTQTITSTLINNENGTFSITFVVDTQPGGSQVITAKGFSPDGTPEATTVFVVFPEILSVAPL